jgi:hypothetical protein
LAIITKSSHFPLNAARRALQLRKLMAADMTLDEAYSKLDDFSRLPLKPGENPYAAFIKHCEDNPVSDVFLSPRPPKKIKKKLKISSSLVKTSRTFD